MDEQVSRRGFMKTTGAAVAIVFFRIPPAGPDSKSRTYAYLVDSRKCIGCGTCVRACSKENHVPEGRFRTWIERYTITTDGKVLVESPEGGRNSFGQPDLKDEEVSKSFFVPKLCNHCANPPCVQVCPIGATFSMPDGTVLVDDKRCMGCGYCVQSCPYSARFIIPEDHVAGKCTWCYHRVTKGMKPACVSVCPVGARRFGEVFEGSEFQKILASEELAVLKPSLGTEPAVFYKGISREVV